MEDLAESKLSSQKSRKLNWERLIAMISLRIQQSLDISEICQKTIDEVYQLLKCDRVLLYQFEIGGHGQVLVEAVSSPQWTLQNRVLHHICSEESGLKPFPESQFRAIADTTKAVNLSPYYIKFLKKFQIKADLVIPILNKSQLWGLLIAHSCTSPRKWLPKEIKGLEQIAVHLGIAIYQAKLIEQLQLTKVNLEAQVESSISELKQANQQLLESDATHRALISAVPDFLVRMRRDGLQREVLNHGAIHCLYASNGINGNYVTDIMPLAIAQERMRLAEIAISTGQLQKQEYEFIDQGKTYYEEARISPLNDEEVLVAVSDITDRKLTEIALRQSENRFLEISESSPSVIYIHVKRSDGSIYFEHISRAIEDIMGISVEQILENALTLLNRIHPDDLAGYAAAVQLSQETLQPFQHEWRMIAASGEIKWLKGNSNPKLRPNGEIAWHGVVTDIGVRKQAELALQQIEAQQHAILEAIPDLMLRVRRDGYCLDFISPHRTTKDQFVPIKQHLSELLPPDLLQCQMQTIEQAIATNELQVYNHQLLKFGNLAYEEVSVTRIDDDEALVIVRDITERKQAEIALRKSERKLRDAYEEQNALVSAITDVVLIRNNEGKFLKIIPTNHQKLLGTPEEVLSRSIYEELPQLAADAITMAIRESLATQTIVSCDYSLEINGQEIWFEANISPIDDDKVIQLSRDITERKLAELALQRSEEGYRHLIENLHAGFIVHSNDTSILFCNSKACDLLGLTLDQMMGKTAIDPAWHFCREDGTVMPLAEYPVNQVLNTGLPLINYVLRINRSDRTKVWVLVNAFPEFDSNQRLQQVAITFIDISDRKQAEAELEKVSERLALSLKSGAIGCWDWDINQNIVIWDDRMYELYGVKKQSDSIAYDVWANGLHPDDRTYIEKITQQAVLGQTEYDVEFRVVHPDDRSIHFIKAYGVVVRDAQGNPQSMIGINFDITDRKQSELALQQSESRFQKIALSSPAVIYILIRRLDGSISFEYVSSAFEDIFEVKIEQILQDFNIYSNMIHPDDRAGYRDAVTYSVEHLTPFEYTWRIITPIKKLKWIQARSRPECREDGTMAWHGVLLDITDQMEGERRLAQIAYHVPGMIYQYRLRPNGSSHFPYASDGIRDIYQVSPDQVKVDASPAFLAIHPDDVERITKSIVESAANLTPWYCEYRVCHDDHIIWVLGHATPQKELDGSIIWHGYISDISDRKQTEIELAKAKEVAETATKSKSQFLANMSHEIRTPMNGVLGMAEVLAGTNLTEEQQDILKTIRDSGEVLLVVINDILDFSKIESGMLKLEERSFILKDLLASICSLLNKQALAKNIVLQYAIESDVPEHFIGDSARLRQIFLNLVGNAIKFTTSGNIHIAIAKNGELQNGKIELTVSVKDNGIGIARDRIDQLFQPFTQADNSISRKYGGTGLGLAISRSLVNLMGGTIWVDSLGKVGGIPPENWTSEPKTSTTQGSSFYFTLVLQVVVETKVTPQATEKDSDKDVNTHQAPIKILLAEDNLFNQKVAVMMLKRLGYIVDIANNGLEVLTMLEQQSYDLILMDMQMPEMDGVTAVKIIRQSNKPQPWIIALTANALEEDRQICFDIGMNDFIAKPISIKQLNRIFSAYRQSHN